MERFPGFASSRKGILEITVENINFQVLSGTTSFVICFPFNNKLAPDSGQSDAEPN